jgi:hypothetical protein
MSTLGEKLDRFLSAVSVMAVLILMVLTNVALSATAAGVTFIQLLAVAGWSKGHAIVASILVAVAVHAYIYFQPQIRNYISVRR